MISIRLLGGIFTALFIILSLINLRLIAYQHQLLSQTGYHENHGIYDDDPHLESLPGYFEEVSMIIEENHRFSLVDDEAWGNTLPGRRGFVRLGPKGRSFEISHFHQLHCLNSIRFSYTMARDGLVKDPDVLKAKIPHGDHCFQYIRQSILCRADNSIVPVNESNQTLSHVGFGITHRCTNWAQVREIVLQTRAKWDDIPYFEAIEQN